VRTWTRRLTERASASILRTADAIFDVFADADAPWKKQFLLQRSYFLLLAVRTRTQNSKICTSLLAWREWRRIRLRSTDYVKPKIYEVRSQTKNQAVAKENRPYRAYVWSLAFDFQLRRKRFLRGDSSMYAMLRSLKFCMPKSKTRGWFWSS